MSCCTNTYNLGCYDHCGVVSFGTATVGGTYTGVFQAGNLSIKQSVIIAEGDPFMFDLSILNEQSDYTLVIYHDGAQISVTIDDVEYDCFRIKTEILGVSTSSVTPTMCTPMCEEIYDPEQVGADVFDYNNLHTTAVGDGVTITGTGTTADPFVAVGGGGGAFDCADLIGCNISNLTNDAGYLASGDNVSELVNDSGYLTTINGLNISLLNNDSGYITNTALAPYLTSATAALTYQPIGAYLTTISGLNISLLNNDSGYITLSSLSGYVPTSRTLTINGVGYDLSADRTWTISASSKLSGLLAADASNTIDNAANLQTWTWNSLTSGSGLVLSSSATGATGNTQNILAISQTGANANASQTTYGLIVSNTKTGATSTNIAGRFVSSGATNNFAIEAESQVKILNSSTGTRYLSFFSGTTENARIGGLNVFGALATDNLDITNNCSMSIVLRTGSSGNGTERMRVRADGQVAIGTTGSGITYALQVDKSTFAQAMNIVSGRVDFNPTNGWSVNVGSSSWVGTGSEDVYNAVGGTMKVYFSSGGVSIGKGSAPNASSVLELTSTTKGFLLPRMTATQGSAISALDGLMIYVTDTNGTFGSVGFYGYENGAWVKL